MKTLTQLFESEIYNYKFASKNETYIEYLKKAVKKWLTQQKEFYLNRKNVSDLESKEDLKYSLWIDDLLETVEGKQ